MQDLDGTPAEKPAAGPAEQTPAPTCPGTDPERLASVVAAEDAPEGAGENKEPLPASTLQELPPGTVEDTSALGEPLPSDSSPAGSVNAPSATTEVLPTYGGVKQASAMVEDAGGEGLLEVRIG